MRELTLEQWLIMAQQLKDLRQSEGWDAYLGRMEVAEHEYMEKMLANESPNRDHWAGFVLGLRYAVQLPERVIARAARLAEDAQEAE